MNVPKRIGLRPHHVDILTRENGDNYQEWEDHMKYLYVEYYPRVFPGAYCLGEESVSRMAKFFRTLTKSPNIEIEVVDTSERDSVCSLCDNLIDGKCKYEGSNSGDKKSQLRYGLSVGEVRKVEKFLDSDVSEPANCN